MVTPIVSILLPFRDHEHVVGQVCRDIADLFRNQDMEFQIVAVDEGSGDNSHAMLAFLRQEIPELQIIVGRGYASGSAAANAETLVLVNIDSAARGICPSLVASVRRISERTIDMELISEQLLVSRADIVVELITTSSSMWRGLTERFLLNRGRDCGHMTRSQCPEPKTSGTISRLLSAVIPRLAPGL